MLRIPNYANSVPVVFAADNYYVPYMSCTMQSVMENASKDRQYSFFVLHKEIAVNSMVLLKKQITNFPQFSIDFIDVSEFISGYDFFISKHISVETYFRLLIPFLFSSYPKVIYLDGDMICHVDIATLFNIDLQDNLLAAVIDIDIIEGNKTKIIQNHFFINELKLPNEYFNAGLVLFSNKQFTTRFILSDILKFASSREFQCHDQDILNILANQNKLLLPIKWNFMPIDKSRINNSSLRQEYCDAFDDYFIIHFKPWQHICLLETFFEEFWKYARKTPFVNSILGNMEKNELIIFKSSLKSELLDNIRYRKGIGLKFIIFDCLKAWLFRDKSNKFEKKELFYENK